ncbi:MAG: YceI family protein [Bacteroidetes bacterium]|nr:YceI family protein [Bacteroidota bacterium]MCY4204205.1 YceI family protein [Bacteroidota bacterium]
MRTFSLFFAILFFVGFSIPTEKHSSWSIDVAHSSISFKVRHLGISNVRGEFLSYDARIEMDESDLSSLTVEATIETASVDTGNERRDGHLRSDDFFGAEEFPTMTFVSTGVPEVDGENFQLEGDLTIRGVTKSIVLEGEFLGTAMMRDTERAGFEATTTVNRKDFNLSWDQLTEAGGLIVGHEVEISLDLELIKVEELD